MGCDTWLTAGNKKHVQYFDEGNLFLRSCAWRTKEVDLRKAGRENRK